jgi:integrase
MTKPYKIPKKPVAYTISIEEILQLGKQINDPELKTLYYLLYLSGARVSEALNMKVKDIQFSYNNDIRLAVFSILTEKNKQHPIREVPVIIKGYEKEMMETIELYISNKLMGEKIFNISRNNAWNKMARILTTIVRANDKKNNRIIESFEKRINPHYLRHCRLTHLRREYGFDAINLMQYAGWSSVQPAQTYLHLGYKDLIKKMKKE